jgi:hypothetical protein
MVVPSPEADRQQGVAFNYGSGDQRSGASHGPSSGCAPLSVLHAASIPTIRATIRPGIMGCAPPDLWAPILCLQVGPENLSPNPSESARARPLATARSCCERVFGPMSSWFDAVEPPVGFFIGQ